MEAKKESLKLILTKDNSHTIFNSELNETYHSIHGAMQESKYVFIEKGLKYFLPDKTINILEVGFGTGLNAMLSLLENKTNKRIIHYTGVEKFPLPLDLIRELNYTGLLQLNQTEEKYFQDLHQSQINKETTILPNFFFTLKTEAFPETKFEKLFDLIYFDAFAPNKQAEMWTEQCFQRCYEILVTGGILVTYCAKGDVKRGLKKAGFQIETLPGPPGKREMIRALKK